MRRIYVSTIMIMVVLLLVSVAASSAPAAGLAAASIPAQTGTDATGGTRKAPPPENREAAPPTSNRQPQVCTDPVINVSATTGNQAESHLVINPTNPQNMVAFSNSSGSSIFRAYTMNGGATWTRGNIVPGQACCDAQAVFDLYGNLFMVYLAAAGPVNVVLSTDGGVTFSAPVTVGTGSVDQPSIAANENSLWVDWNQGGSMRARGAPITGLGAWGPFAAVQTPPSATGTFGGIAVGPSANGGKVMIAYQTQTGQAPSVIYGNVDPDGLGPMNFGPRFQISTTNVGDFDYIPAQSGRSIDSEAGLVWDYSGGPFNNRVYMMYTDEVVNEGNDTEIYVRTSINDGATWTAPVRVNDDPLGPIRSQFLPYIALDRTTGTVGVSFHDARNDNGVPGSGGTNTIPNDDSEYYASYTTDGGATWSVNDRLSGGFSNADAANNGVDYGDYVGTDAHGGKYVGMWADNANCDGTNANGTLAQFDLYMGVMNLPGGGTATPTVTGTLPTATGTSVLPTGTPTRTNTATNTATSTRTNTATSTSTATNTPVPPTGMVPTGTATSIPSNTPTRTNTATNTPVPPTGTATACTLMFTDVPTDHTFYENIRCLACRGIINGYSSGCATGNPCFKPGNNVTRGQLAKIVSNSAGFSDPAGPQQFEDVPPGSTFFDYIWRLAFRGIVTGYPCGGPGEPCIAPDNRPYFRPNADVTRGQLSKIVAEAAGLTQPAGAQQFEDVPPGHTFYDYIWRLTSLGIMQGYPCGGEGEPCNPPGNLPYFRPGKNATRGQASKIVANTFFPDCTTPNRVGR
jgi:hypothetical protein